MPGAVVRGTRDVWGCALLGLRPLGVGKRCAVGSYVADRERVRCMRIGRPCAGLMPRERGGVSNPSMGGANPPAVVLDRNGASG